MDKNNKSNIKISNNKIKINQWNRSKNNMGINQQCLSKRNE